MLLQFNLGVFNLLATILYDSRSIDHFKNIRYLGNVELCVNEGSIDFQLLSNQGLLYRYPLLLIRRTMCLLSQVNRRIEMGHNFRLKDLRTGQQGILMCSLTIGRNFLVEMLRILKNLNVEPYFGFYLRRFRNVNLTMRLFHPMDKNMFELFNVIVGYFSYENRTLGFKSKYVSFKLKRDDMPMGLLNDIERVENESILLFKDGLKCLVPEYWRFNLQDLTDLLFSYNEAYINNRINSIKITGDEFGPNISRINDFISSRGYQNEHPYLLLKSGQFRLLRRGLWFSYLPERFRLERGFYWIYPGIRDGDSFLVLSRSLRGEPFADVVAGFKRDINDIVLHQYGGLGLWSDRKLSFRGIDLAWVKVLPDYLMAILVPRVPARLTRVRTLVKRPTFVDNNYRIEGIPKGSKPTFLLHSYKDKDGVTIYTVREWRY